MIDAFRIASARIGAASDPNGCKAGWVSELRTEINGVKRVFTGVSVGGAGEPVLHVAVAVVAAPQPVPLVRDHRLRRVLQKMVQQPCSTFRLKLTFWLKVFLDVRSVQCLMNTSTASSRRCLSG